MSDLNHLCLLAAAGVGDGEPGKRLRGIGEFILKHLLNMKNFYEYIIHLFIVNKNAYVGIFQTQSIFKNIFFINM